MLSTETTLPTNKWHLIYEDKYTKLENTKNDSKYLTNDILS